MTSRVGGMTSPDDWDSAEKVMRLLAGRLVKKRLSLFLGAGASFGFGLPSWEELVRKLYDAAGRVVPSPPDPERHAEQLFVEHYGSDRIAFASAVQSVLYDGTSLDDSSLDQNRLLSAIAALTMSSVRGSVANVVTFNFDDILETYLRYRGFAVESVDTLPKWNSDVDVRVLHPHGLLRIDRVSPSHGIVLTQLDYDAIVGNAKDLWRQKLTEIMRSSTCLFVGLSGVDKNLTSMLMDVHGNHSVAGSEPFWGVRFAERGDSMTSTWRARGVYVSELASYNELPAVLLDICRRAATLR